MEVIRGSVLLAWGFAYDDQQAARLRYRAFAYLSGFSDEAGDFESLVAAGKRPNVVVSATDMKAQTILQHSAYSESVSFSGFKLFVLSPEP